VNSLVPRDDGTFQQRAGVWPLYRFAGDAAPGETNGQGSGGVWFAAAPDGSLIGSGNSGGAAPTTEPADTGDAGTTTTQPDQGNDDGGYGDERLLMAEPS
jgi:hypothetical protein